MNLTNIALEHGGLTYVTTVSPELWTAALFSLEIQGWQVYTQRLGDYLLNSSHIIALLLSLGLDNWCVKNAPFVVLGSRYDY